MLAAVHRVAHLQAVADHADVTVRAAQQGIDGALEGVERVDLAVVSRDGERLGVVVPEVRRWPWKREEGDRKGRGAAATSANE